MNNTVEVFFNDYNYAKKETKNLMSFCRLSVEIYLFSKVICLFFRLKLKNYMRLNFKIKIFNLMKKQIKYSNN